MSKNDDYDDKLERSGAKSERSIVSVPAYNLHGKTIVVDDQTMVTVEGLIQENKQLRSDQENLLMELNERGNTALTLATKNARFRQEINTLRGSSVTVPTRQEPGRLEIAAMLCAGHFSHSKYFRPFEDFLASADRLIAQHNATKDNK